MVDVIQVEKTVYLVVKLHEGQLFYLDQVRQSQSFHWKSEALKTKYRNKQEALYASIEGGINLVACKIRLKHLHLYVNKKEWWAKINAQYPHTRGHYGTATDRKAA